MHLYQAYCVKYTHNFDCDWQHVDTFSHCVTTLWHMFCFRKLSLKSDGSCCYGMKACKCDFCIRVDMIFLCFTSRSTEYRSEHFQTVFAINLSIQNSIWLNFLWRLYWNEIKLVHNYQFLILWNLHSLLLLLLPKTGVGNYSTSGMHNQQINIKLLKIQ